MKVYKSNRVEQLQAALSELLRREPPRPFEAISIGVHDSGLGQWLVNELSDSLGICSGVKTRGTVELLARALVDVSERGARDSKRWLPACAVWPIFECIRDLIRRPSFAELAHYLTDDTECRGAKSFRLALTIAALFHKYLLYRHDIVESWLTGSGRGWQAELYREVARRIGQPNPVELIRELERLALGGRLESSTLPSQLLLFSVETLPPFSLRILSALDRLCDIRLFLFTPTSEYWADIVPQKKPLASWREEDFTREEGHPLVASWGRLGRELHAQLEDAFDYEEPRSDLFVDPAATEAPTMLEVLQSDMLELRARGAEGAAPAWPIAEHDRSIAVHACHGLMRQLEVLNDHLLELFSRDPSLEPRDVLVMTPDIVDAAPLIEAVFDRQFGDPRNIPYRIVDVPFRRQSAVAEAFLRALDLAGRRLTTAEVLDLLALRPIAARFDIDAEAITTLIEWVGEAGARWGIDETHRVEHGQPPYRENSWRFTLDRLLLGYAYAGRGRWLYRGMLPYDELEGGSGTLLGRLIDFSETLFRHVALLEGGPRSLTEWRDVALSLLDELVDEEGDTGRARGRVRELLQEIVEDADVLGEATDLDLGAFRELVDDRLSQRDQARGFDSGALTFAELTPLRAVPFEVIALVGLDDDRFPRRATSLSFDLTKAEHRWGDRSVADEDRQLFLDAVLSARSALIVTYSGFHLRDNQRRPPSVVIAELLDVLSEAFTPAQGSPDARELSLEERREAIVEQVKMEHPLHPFSPRAFDDESDPRRFSYARGYLGGARALQAERRPRQPFLSATSTFDAPGKLALESVIGFWEQPCRAYLDQRLGLRWFGQAKPLGEREPTELDALERYSIARKLLERRLAGEELDRAYDSTRAEGVLPWGVPGQCVFEEIVEDVEAMTQAVLAEIGDREVRAPVAFELALADGKGTRLGGRIASLFVGSPSLITYRYSRLKAKYLLSLWLRHLVLRIHDGGAPGSSVLVARHKRSGAPTSYRFDGPDDPEAALSELVELSRLGLQRPLLFFTETSVAYAKRYLETEGDRSAALEAAVSAWRGGGGPGAPPGEGDEAALVRIFDSDEPYRPGYRPPWVDDGEVDEFHELALRVAAPLLGALEEGES